MNHRSIISVTPYIARVKGIPERFEAMITDNTETAIECNILTRYASDGAVQHVTFGEWIPLSQIVANIPAHVEISHGRKVALPDELGALDTCKICGGFMQYNDDGMIYSCRDCGRRR